MLSKSKFRRNKVLQVIERLTFKEDDHRRDGISSNLIKENSSVGGPLLSHAILGLLKEGKIEPVVSSFGGKRNLRWRVVVQPDEKIEESSETPYYI